MFQALSVIRAVRKQRVMGRDVFAVSQPVDNVGGTKFDCYCSQMIGSLFVHGKLRSMGDLFTEHVLVDGQRSRGDNHQDFLFQCTNMEIIGLTWWQKE